MKTEQIIFNEEEKDLELENYLIYCYDMEQELLKENKKKINKNFS